MNFTETLQARCLKRGAACVAFPESMDERTLAAVDRLVRGKILKQASLYGDRHKILEQARKTCGLNWDEAFDKNFLRFVAPTASQDPLFAAGEDLKLGHVQAVIAGAVHTTADVIRATLKTVGVAKDCKTISGSFFLHRAEGGKTENELLMFADAGVVIEPSIEQLADIAWSSVQTWCKVAGTEAEPKVAFLSFSTAGSAKHASVEKMVAALAKFRAAHPEIAAEGEMQFDAAYDRHVGLRKMPHSKIAGSANIFIFPDLNSGNISYKIAQRLGGFSAFGPILQGSAKPYSDLSRGASVDDIVAVTCINILLG